LTRVVRPSRFHEEGEQRLLDRDALLNPRAVMLVGASRDPHKAGGAILRNLIREKPEFRIHAVNPRPFDLPGAHWSRSVADVPERCDLAIVAVRAALVPEVIASLASHGTKVAVVISAGLTKANALLDAALQAARTTGLRILGPNCLGVLIPPVALDASFAASGALPGKLAFLSQSGALAAAVLDWAREREIGFSVVASIGDMADIGLDELVRLFGDDERTSAILVYLEGLADARPFLDAVRDLGGRKPVIVLKAGRTQAAARAAQSHTGALAGAFDVYRAAFRQHGIVVVETLEELFEAAEVLARCSAPRGNRLAVITNGGGAGILAADALANGAGKLATLSAGTVAALDAFLPPAWSRANPVDLIGDADADRYGAAIQAVLADAENYALLVMTCPTALRSCDDITAAVTEAVRTSGSTKPVLACWLGDANARCAAHVLEAAGIPLFDTPEDAVHGHSYLVQASRAVAAAPHIGREASEETMDEVRALVGAVRADARLVLSELEAKALLAHFGIPVVPTRGALTPGDVYDACGQIEPPYVIKIVSPDLTHKSDLGGVALGLADAEAAMCAAKAMHDRIRAACPGARLRGFSVQPMIRRKQAHELFCGVATDPAFGAVLMVGAGGTAVEVLADRAIRLPPIDQHDAEAMIAETRISRLLAGYRDVPATRLDAIAEVLVALLDLVRLVPEIAELDINPLLAHADGVVALDARVILAPN
jgi:acetyltransferase